MNPETSYPKLKQQAQQHVQKQQKFLLQQQLNLRLNKINDFNSSIQIIKDIKNFYNHGAEKYRKKSKQFKLINGRIEYIDGILILGISASCVTLSVTWLERVLVPIATGIGAGLCTVSKIACEYLKRKEQHFL